MVGGMRSEVTKRTLMTLFLVGLTGCDTAVSGLEIQKAAIACASHKGVHSIEHSTLLYEYKATCVDGVRIIEGSR